MIEPFKLCIPDVPGSYEGRLYFILGPGLGDTVNDFRILHEVLSRYPYAKPIVYADPRWKGLYELVPELTRCVLRFHVSAPSGELAGKKKEIPYSETLREVLQEIQAEIEESPAFVALGGFTCLDQLARKEQSLSTKARSIGLSLSPERCRPFLPLNTTLLEEAQKFLFYQGLQPGHYIAMAPQTWPDKAWKLSCWEKLSRDLYEKEHLPALVLGVKGCEIWKAPGVYPALGLSLPLVAALVAHARCFVGLDSGLTHIAACFDIPIVAMQAQGKFPPFLVEPHSPYRRVHLTPFIYGSVTIPEYSVQALVQETMRSSSAPLCPLCEQVPYVLGANSNQVAYLCRCGLIFRFGNVQEKLDEPSTYSEIAPLLPSTVDGLHFFMKQLQRKEEGHLLPQAKYSITKVFDHWIAREVSPEVILEDPTGRELWWSWDAVNHLLLSLGWQIFESYGKHGSKGGGAPYSFVVKASPKGGDTFDSLLQVPWGKELVRIQWFLYSRWLCWESFERLNELEDLGWSLVENGWERDGRDILRFVARREWRGRTLGRLIRSEWKALGSGMKNSKEIPVSV